MESAGALVPLALALLALASERVRARVARAPYAAALLVPLSWLVRAWDVHALDPLALALVVLLSLAPIFALSTVEAGEPKLTLVDLVVGLLLFVPLDLRWSYALWPGRHGGYEFWALAAAYLAALGWGCAPRALPSLGHRPPALRDAAIGLAALLGFAVIAIPVGLATGFLAHPNTRHFEAGRAALEALGLVLTVALPEEIFFRGVLDGALRATVRSPWLSLALSSIAFGVMHWPRSDHLQEKLIYMALAAVAGVFYGLAYRRSGGLPAAVICHTAVDWVWLEVLRK